MATLEKPKRKAKSKSGKICQGIGTNVNVEISTTTNINQGPRVLINEGQTNEIIQINEDTTNEEQTNEITQTIEEQKNEITQTIEAQKSEIIQTIETEVEAKIRPKQKTTPKIVTYPELPRSETSETSKINETNQIKPFTETQLTGLYTNAEIAAANQFTSEFIETELRGIVAKNHPLYDSITAYLGARQKLHETSIEVSQLRTDLTDTQTQLWTITDANATAKAQCADNATVSATHSYKTAHFQRNLLESVTRLQNKIERLTSHVYSLYAYKSCVLKLKIEYYLDAVYARCDKYLDLSESVALREIAPGEGTAALHELRACISVLFYFQRILNKDRDVLRETRRWLASMVSLLLRNANWQDHMYLLNHVLRCPAGIHTWAVRYIQVPGPLFCERNDAPFANRYVNHVVAVLSVILMPIDKRDAFLEQIISTLNEPTDMVAENLWVLVDSDGESDDDTTGGILSLKENDLVALLNQIPLDYLFRAILLIDRKDNEDVLDAATFTEHHILRLFAFSTCLVRLINNGLATYSTTRYNQFAKRLCRLMRHILQYVSDAWELFTKSACDVPSRDGAMMDRLQVEFDAFFLRTTRFLYSAQPHGSWQFLAVAPFHMVSTRMLWRFYYMLHQNSCSDNEPTPLRQFNYKEKLSETSQKQQFHDRLCVMSVEQAYYLLNTFGNMIMARSHRDDDDFIEFATLNLLQIGFTDTDNQESSRKCAAILLSNITGKYPALISDILTFIRANIRDLESLIFLFSELPLYLWQPTERDFDVLSIWLIQNPVNSVENFLARKILLNLNYGNMGQELFLPLVFHRKIAVLVLEAVEKHQGAELEDHLGKFAWSLVYQLRLHATDRNTARVENIPDLIRFDVVQRGVRRKEALALYCAVAMTTVGHLLPLVCADGLAYILELALLGKHDAALISLGHVVPLFVDNIDALLMCTTYQAIVLNLLNADKTYYKMAKNLVAAEGTGDVLAHLAVLIHVQLHHPAWRPLFLLWARTLLAVPQWYANKSVLLLLDHVASAAFFVPDAWQQIDALFNQLLTDKIHDRNNSSNSSLLSWVPLVGNSQANGSAILLQGNASNDTWFMYLVISLEHQQIEVKSGLWPELLKQLFANKGKTNVDASLKKSANILKIPSYTSNGLCIYRWCQLALDTPLDHPLLPLIWQKFFSLYLIRVPGLENSGSVGSKFFDGVINTNFLKKIKKRLQESCEYYKSKRDEVDARPEFLDKCLSIFKAYVLWLEEPILMEATLYFPSLPPQYEPRYLSHIIQNTTSPWLEFINLEELRNNYEHHVTKWMHYCSRAKKFRPPLQKIGAGDLINPRERLLRRLNTYDRPIAPPQFERTAAVIPIINIGDNPENFQPSIKKLQQYAEIFALQLSEHAALDAQYNDLVPQLYQKFTSKIHAKKTCKPTCAGVANIRLVFTESRINETIKHQLETNRNNFSAMLARCLQPPAVNMCATCASCEQTVDSLNAQYADARRLNDAPRMGALRALGTELFYFFLGTFNDDFRNFPPTQQMFHNCLEKLGGGFLRGVETEALRLLRKIIESPGQSSLLVPQFVVRDFSTDVFLQLYQEISQQLQVIPEITVSLLSKFDVPDWLNTKCPRLADRTKFIQNVFDALSKLPGRKHATLQEVYRRHLLTIFQFDFPNHYGEILTQMLQHSGAQTLIVDVWLDVINTLTHPVCVTSADQMRRYATQQQRLERAVLTETIGLLARYFARERLQFGLYGLYPKYRGYVEQIALFAGLVYHAYAVAVLNTGSGELAENLVAVYLWPKLGELFTPWLVPYTVGDTTATWIQQLTDDRAVLLPWIQADIKHAQVVFSMFVNCVLFIGDILPASSSLCYVWQFYASNYAHASVKEHVLMVAHASLAQINWEKFWPTLNDLEIMLKVLGQYLPECHAFLGQVFLDVNWTNWLTHLMHQTVDGAIVRRVHHCLLHLLVKLSNEPTVRQNDRARGLMEKSREFASWFLVDVQSLESVFDWYIMSCDPRVVLVSSAEMVKQIDCAAYQLLRIVSYYNININEMQENAQILPKRQCFVRAFIKILINCSSRYKNLLSTSPQLFTDTLNAQLDYLETILNKVSEESKPHNADILIREYLVVVNHPCLSQQSMTCLNQWLSNRSGNNVIVCSVLRSVQIISDDDILSCILERALASYFNETQDVVDWAGALSLLDNLPPRQKFEAVLVNNGRLLALYSILMKKIRFLPEDDAKSTELLLEMVVSWLTNIKCSDLIEDKLPLFWVQIIRLCLKLCHFGNEEKSAVILRMFVHQHLLLVAENKGAPSESGAVSWGRGLLGAIGLIKQNSVSLQCRFLCKSMAAYILAQLPDARSKAASVRCFSRAGHPVGQPGGNVECARILLKLEPSGSTTELKSIVETTLKQVQDPQNSLHNAEDFLFSLINLLYTDKIYLQSL